MSFNRGRVERQRDSIFAGLGQRFKDRAPSSALGPPVEAIVDGRVRAVFTRAIAPSRTRLQHVNDSADDTPVVVPIWPRQSRRQMRLDTRPLPVIQPKQTRAHSLAPESKPRGKGITSRYSGTDPSPPGFWYDQAWNEWVIVLKGNAKLQFEHEPAARTLSTGDYVFIPARKRHRVEWTEPQQPTIWLAVHFE